MNQFVCFGEVLWDVFKTHKTIGGAPLNVANRLAAFGNTVSLISAVGNDALGQEILHYLKNQSLDVSTINNLQDYDTGKVSVSLNKKGAASYEIEYPKAWDKIPFAPVAAEKVKHSKAFIYGSLATRDEVSKTTLYSYLKVAPFKVFDVNVRKPFYHLKTLESLLQQADFIKFNDEELHEIAADLQSPYHNLEQNIHFIASKTKTSIICVTKGEHGAVLLWNSKLYYNSGFAIKVKDTVGAGDSFLAALLHQLMAEAAPQYALDFACAVGALVAREVGANPIITTETIARFLQP